MFQGEGFETIRNWHSGHDAVLDKKEEEILSGDYEGRDAGTRFFLRHFMPTVFRKTREFRDASAGLEVPLGNIFKAALIEHGIPTNDAENREYKLAREETKSLRYDLLSIPTSLIEIPQPHRVPVEEKIVGPDFPFLQETFLEEGWNMEEILDARRRLKGQLAKRNPIGDYYLYMRAILVNLRKDAGGTPPPDSMAPDESVI